MITKEASKWFRGAAIVMVVASHYAEWIGAGNNEALREFVARLGDFGVDIFFLVSGYGLAKAAGNSKISLDFVWRRVVSAYLPYLLIIGGLEIWDGVFVSEVLADKESLLEFLTGYDYWFMMNLFVFYLLFFICWNYKYVRILTLAAGVYLYSNYLFEQGRAEFWYVSNIAFVAGALYAEIEPLLLKIFKESVFKISGAVIMAGSLYYGNRVFLLPDEAGTLVILHLVFSIGTALLASGKWMKGYVLPVLGNYSLYFYLLHTRLFHAIYWSWEEVDGFVRTAGVFVISAVICMIVGFLCQDVMFKCLIRKKKA